MKKTIFFVAFILFACTVLQAQNEYRIKQELPKDIDSISVEAGWQVKLSQGEQSSLTVVTICQAFFDDDVEPQICTVEGKQLNLLENSSMPKSTVVEIVVSKPLKYISVEDNAHLETGRLVFAGAVQSVDVHDGATVRGTTWQGEKNMHVGVFPDGSLELDSLIAGRSITVSQFDGSRMVCPVVESPDTKIRRGPRVEDFKFSSDTSRHITVKQSRILTRQRHALVLNGGITAPIPLYMNNKSGSAYNRGENYRIDLRMKIDPGLSLAKNLNFNLSWLMEVEWSRLLNSVKTEGNSLVLDNSYGALNPQQHLLGQRFGFDFNFDYHFGKSNSKTGMRPYRLSFGVAAMMNGSGRLVTRTMGSDNRWHREREKVDVFNPWMLRAHLGIGGGPLTRATVSLTYDLLPTFRSGVGADKTHTFGVSISF